MTQFEETADKKNEEAKLHEATEPQSKDQTSASISQQELNELKEKIKEQEAKYLYLYAEFENFKKRTVKERSEIIKFGWEGVAKDLLSILDNLTLALSHVPSNTDKNFVDGLQMIANHFFSTLQRQAVTRIETVEKTFDPNIHEAVEQVFSDLPAGTIVKEHTQGYLLHGRLLRPARVTISKGKQPASQ